MVKRGKEEEKKKELNTPHQVYLMTKKNLGIKERYTSEIQISSFFVGICWLIRITLLALVYPNFDDELQLVVDFNGN
ncbi:MAG: hypothetical protein ACFFDC_15110 [Promethearchaeota archaeon]